jgi:hypothetical protein
MLRKSMMAPVKVLRSSRMAISLQVGAHSIGPTTSKMDRKIKSVHSTENSNILQDHLKSIANQVFGDQMESVLSELSKVNLEIAGCWQPQQLLLNRKKELRKYLLTKNTTLMVFSCSIFSTWASQSRLLLMIISQSKKMGLRSNKRYRPTKQLMVKSNQSKISQSS